LEHAIARLPSRLRDVAGSAVTVLLLALAGCSTPGRSVQQTLRVETPGCVAATCTLSNDRGQWTLARSPGAVTVSTSHAPLQVACRADSGALGQRGAASAVPERTGIGGLLGGAAGGGMGAVIAAPAAFYMPPLAVVSVLAGIGLGAVAGQSAESGQLPLRYPERIEVHMNCSAADPLPASLPGVALGLGIRGLGVDELPPAWRAAETPARGAVLVLAVSPGGAAAAAGLQAGDIVVAAGGQAVPDAAALEERVRSLAAGAPLVLRLWRDGQWQERTLTRAAAP
jgi:membrane-associated protease RseP (regulator of RpoE activity)